MSAGADPFADAAPGGAGVNDDPFAEVDAMEPGAPAQEDIPTVDREGQPVVPAAAPDATDPAAPQAPAVEVNEEGGETPVPEPAPVQPAEVVQPADQMAPVEPVAETPAAPAEEPPAAPSAPEEAPEAPAPAEEPPAAPEPPAEVPAPAPAEEATPAAVAAPPVAPEAPAADPPADDRPRGGKGEMRHYKALYQTDAKQWTEFPLDGKLPEGAESVKVVTIDGELYFEARNNDHATRIAFVLLGQPAEGVTVWPVPKGAFKPKRVKPAAPKPERTRLEIS